MKLSNAETNNTFLERQLQQQLAQKADLERKFNDLSTVRAQVKKLRDEAFVARRLELMHVSATGNEGRDAAESSRDRHQHPAGAAAKRSPHYDLNVEVGSDGSVHVIPPPAPRPIRPDAPPAGAFVRSCRLTNTVARNAAANLKSSQPISAAPLEICPKALCARKKWGRGRVKKKISAGAGLLFKGSGFYITDYRSKNYTEAAKKDSAPAKSPAAKAETKPASAQPAAKAEK